MKTLISTFFLILFHLASYEQEWNTLDDVELSGSAVNVFKVYDDVLYIGAGIFDVNGQESIGLLLWDSISINSLSSGFASPQDMDFLEGDLYIVGNFNDILEIPGTIGVASWTNGEWHSVSGGGLYLSDHPGSVRAYQGKIYISRDFSNMGPLTELDGFAAWDGNEWTAPESVYGFDLGPRVMCVFDGYLWGGGDIDFTTEGVSINNIARFDGEHWYDLNGGMSGTVQAFYPDEEEGRLYAGGSGSLAQFGDVSCPNNVVYWDGENWNPVGIYNDINYDIKALTKYRGQIYAGGYFQLNGVTEKLAYFDGVHWQAVPGAETIDGAVDVLEVYKDELYIGGTFTEMGGLEVPGLIRYYLHPDSVQWGVEDTTWIEDHSSSLDFTVYPNPTNSFLQIQFSKPEQGELTISDALGNTILSKNFEGQKTVSIDVKHVTAGSYILSWRKKGELISTKRVLIE